jgi:hypothetical protein
MGLHRAGFDVFGIDWTGQRHYPFPMKVERVERLSPEWIRSFDLVWASPPCQKWSIGTQAHPHPKVHPDLIPMTRALLHQAGIPSVIENVPQAPLRADLRLCGSMFGLRLVRHRHFELQGFQAPQPAHRDHHWRYVTVTGTPGGKNGHPGGYGLLADWQEAMGIDWMSAREMAEAIPPAYSHHIARAFLSSRPIDDWAYVKERLEDGGLPYALI